MPSVLVNVRCASAVLGCLDVINVDEACMPLKVLHYNIQGLCNKNLQLEILLRDERVDVLCLNEHWLTQGELNSLVINIIILASRVFFDQYTVTVALQFMLVPACCHYLFLTSYSIL